MDDDDDLNSEDPSEVAVVPTPPLSRLDLLIHSVWMAHPVLQLTADI